MAVIDNAVYVNGRRTTDPETLDETFEVLRDRKGLAWIGLYRPDENEIRTVAAEFELHELPVQDAISAHQRPKMERYGDTLFVWCCRPSSMWTSRCDAICGIWPITPSGW